MPALIGLLVNSACVPAPPPQDGPRRIVTIEPAPAPAERLAPLDGGFVSLGAVEAEGDAGAPALDAGAPPLPATIDAGAAGEVCDNGLDDDADGAIDEGCLCTNSQLERRCSYGGPLGTEGVGVCRGSAQRCVDRGAGLRWTECGDEVRPRREDRNTDGPCADGFDDDCDGVPDNGCIAPQAPVVCTTMALTHVIGASDCGTNQAVYMMDDGDGPNFICCTLPATDILTTDPPTVRGAQCGADEVITGAVGRSNFKCTRINTQRYQLAAPQRPCYFGRGASGGGGVGRCASHPTSFSVLQNNMFGSDGCSSQPYGALFVRQSGDDCRDMSAAELQYSGGVATDPRAGTPVVMFSDR